MAETHANNSPSRVKGWQPLGAADGVVDGVVLARWGEIHLKGANRGFFLNALKKNLQAATGADVKIEDGRAIIKEVPSKIESVDDKSQRTDKTTRWQPVGLTGCLEAAANTFGVVSVSSAVEVPSAPEAILEYLKTIKPTGTFKVEVNRADKNFPHKSVDFASIAGGVIDAPVDIHNPQTVVSIDIRERTYIYFKSVAGVGGLPVGTAGRALCLLSGGIDSPVAAYLAAKRGLAVDFIHFASPPYTSDFALEKVKDLVHELEKYIGSGSTKPCLYIVPFTEIQEAIRKNCPSEFMITIMRRFMIRIAERVALNHKADCIITGENLAQVASQTVAGIASNNCCASVLPILRPLITYDKSEIITLARKIGTYDTSCKPYPDCCTVFVPKHPSITPNLKKVETSEAKLDVEILINNAVNGIIVSCSPMLD